MGNFYITLFTESIFFIVILIHLEKRIGDVEREWEEKLKKESEKDLEELKKELGEKE